MKYLDYTHIVKSRMKSLNDGKEYTIDGKLEFRWDMYLTEFLSEFRDLLEEKGAAYFMTGCAIHSFQCHLYSVPKRMYHEVLIPALRHTCALWNVRITPISYFKHNGDRELHARYRLDQPKLMAKAVAEFQSGGYTKSISVGRVFK